MKKITFFPLLMLALISVDSIRNVPVNAQYGYASITFYLFAGLFFFFPLSFITSRLSVLYPLTGGSYIWIQTAFGRKWGFISIWFQWVYQLIWYPTIFAFISATLTLLFAPSWAQNPHIIFLISFVLFWVMTLLSCFGVRALSGFAIFCALIGTLIPMFTIIVLAIVWLALKHPPAMTWSWSALIPTHSNWLNLTFFANILFSLLGIDVIAMHAADVQNAASTFPRVLRISSVVILFSLACSSVALCIIIPPQQIGLLTGLMSGFATYLNQYHLSWGIPLIGTSIIFGGLGIASSWILSLARGLHVASHGSQLPKSLHALNRYQVPYRILIGQGIIVTCLLSTFTLFPNINHSYWMLSALTAQFALLYYVLLFLATLFLFFKAKLLTRYSAFWIGGAILVSFFGICIGFIPPANLRGLNAILCYELLLAGGGLVFLLPIFYFFRKLDRCT